MFQNMTKPQSFIAFSSQPIRLQVHSLWSKRISVDFNRVLLEESGNLSGNLTVAWKTVIGLEYVLKLLKYNSHSDDRWLTHTLVGCVHLNFETIQGNGKFLFYGKEFVGLHLMLVCSIHGSKCSEERCFELMVKLDRWGQLFHTLDGITNTPPKSCKLPPVH